MYKYNINVNVREKITQEAVLWLKNDKASGPIGIIIELNNNGAGKFIYGNKPCFASVC